jgi:1-deoxy-D-xylulose-5-phosphate reductoisomerase
VEEALRHPTWRMGKKITVDSATLANKALEVIEAHYLFDLDFDQIDIVVHPQSVVHSFVEFVDGSVLAQMGVPNMELPVLYALTHPRRVADMASVSFDPVALSPLTFERVRHDDFPALLLGIEAGRAGGAAPAVFNAANEQAVEIFLQGKMRFGEIPRAIAAALEKLRDEPGDSRDALQSADTAARSYVREKFGC